MQCSCNNNTKPLQKTEFEQGKQKPHQRFIDYAKMVAAACVFALIPKCPVCLAAYVAVATGVGLSITTATYIRFGLIVLCIASLSYFVFKHMRRWMVRNG